MSNGPFPDRGQDGEEPESSRPLPADRNGPDNRDPAPSGDQESDATPSAVPPGQDDATPEEPMQGLFICLPAEQADLAGFTDGSSTHPIAPGPLLAEVVTAVTGGDRAGLAQISEDCLFSVLSAGRRMSSWGTWLELAAMHELAVRHPASQDQPAAPDILSAADAARADPDLAAAAQAKTYGELRAAATARKDRTGTAGRKTAVPAGTGRGRIARPGPARAAGPARPGRTPARAWPRW